LHTFRTRVGRCVPRWDSSREIERCTSPGTDERRQSSSSALLMCLRWPIWSGTLAASLASDSGGRLPAHRLRGRWCYLSPHRTVWSPSAAALRLSSLHTSGRSDAPATGATTARTWWSRTRVRTRPGRSRRGRRTMSRGDVGSSLTPTSEGRTAGTTASTPLRWARGRGRRSLAQERCSVQHGTPGDPAVVPHVERLS
jgi:hypothetical protein